MAETDLFPLKPDYILPEEVISGVLSQTAADGSIQQRLQKASQRLWELKLRRRSTDQAEQLRDWYARFQNSFFRFDHSVYINNSGVYLPRSFPVHFAGPPSYELVHNEGWSMRAQFIEAVGKVLPSGSYPDPTTGFPSFFQEEDHENAYVIAGTWTVVITANAHAGEHKTNPNTNTTDAFQWVYSGYGFRLWSAKSSSVGILGLYVDGVFDSNVDLYNATTIPSAPIVTKLDLPLGLHRVELRATNTKNISSAGNTIIADAIEVMP